VKEQEEETRGLEEEAWRIKRW